MHARPPSETTLLEMSLGPDMGSAGSLLFRTSTPVPANKEHETKEGKITDEIIH